MKRREFIAALGGAAAAWPLATRAQQRARRARIGFLGLNNPVTHAPRLEALRQGLRDLGYVEGRNIDIELRWADGQYDRLPMMATELVNLNVDILLTHAMPGVLAAKQATSRVPIVITAAADLLAYGIVSSLSRPGGNITGLSIFSAELAAKRLELLKELQPNLTKAAVVLNATNPAGGRLIQRELEKVAELLNVQLQTFEVAGPHEFERAFAMMVDHRIGGVIIHEDPMLNANSRALADLVARHRLPTCGYPEFVAAGGLMSYGINFPDMDRRAATFVDKILKGAEPGDLPIERATKFSLMVNLKVAKAMGLEIPTSILLRADQVIE